MPGSRSFASSLLAETGFLLPLPQDDQRSSKSFCTLYAIEDKTFAQPTLLRKLNLRRGRIGAAWRFGQCGTVAQRALHRGANEESVDYDECTVCRSSSLRRHFNCQPYVTGPPDNRPNLFMVGDTLLNHPVSMAGTINLAINDRNVLYNPDAGQQIVRIIVTQ